MLVNGSHPIPRTNKRLQLTVKSVTIFAYAKTAPLFTSTEAGVIEELELRSSSSITPR